MKKIIKNICLLFFFLSTLPAQQITKKKLRIAESDNEKQVILAEAEKKWIETCFKHYKIHLEIIGSENIPEENGVFFVSNHESYIDIISFIYALRGHQVGFVGRDNLKKIPFLGKWMERIRCLFIKRGNSRDGLRVFKEGVLLLEQGYNLVIFPEGTRSKGGPIKEFKAGSLKMATTSKSKIVPVAVKGTSNVYEKYGYIQKGGTAKISFGRPFLTDNLDRIGIQKLHEEVRNEILEMHKNL